MILTASIAMTLLVIKHFIADFVLQSDTMIREKGTYGKKGGIDHACCHAFLTLLFLAPMIAFLPGSLYIWPVAILDGVVHYHIDWAKMNLSKGLTPADHKFWVWIGIDQLLHYLTYIGIVYVVVS